MPITDCPACGRPLHEEQPLGVFRGVLSGLVLLACIVGPTLAIWLWR